MNSEEEREGERSSEGGKESIFHGNITYRLCVQDRQSERSHSSHQKKQATGKTP